MQSAPDQNTSLRYFPWVIIRLRCHYCQRSADARLASCAAKFGQDTTIGDLMNLFVRRCPWNPHSALRKPQKYGHKCGAYCPDIGRTSPPDLPPSLTGLTLIEGGKGDMLPAEPGQEPARRRVGGE